LAEKQKILVIDDEAAITKLLAAFLTRDGYDAIELNDPTKVEDYLLFTELDLVVTDLQMPEMDGIGVLQTVRLSKPNIPVFILTGYGDIGTAVEATKLGAAEFLTKPIDFQTFQKAVKKHLSRDELLPGDIKALIEGRQFPGKLKSESGRLLLEEEIVSPKTLPAGFVEVRFEEIVPGEKLPFNLYLQIHNKKTDKHFLRKICQANIIFTPGLRSILFKRNLQSVYIEEEDYRAYLKYLSHVRSIPRFKEELVKEKKQLVLYGKAVEAVTEILSGQMSEEKSKIAASLVDDLFRVMVKDPELYQNMYNLFRQEPNIFNHSANVCLLIVSFGLHLKLGKESIKTLGLGALFHDIGMNNISPELLKKKGPLTKDEWRELKEHPSKGADQLKSATFVSESVIRIVLEHHEEEDGSGYPMGLKGDEISRLSHFIRIVDKFDAMTTERPYRAAYSSPEALKHIYFSEPSKEFKGLIRKFIQYLGGLENKDKI
jgi:response regulator RpfG family c-di-GMP phosphodiesterase